MEKPSHKCRFEDNRKNKHKQCFKKKKGKIFLTPPNWIFWVTMISFTWAHTSYLTYQLRCALLKLTTIGLCLIQTGLTKPEPLKWGYYLNFILEHLVWIGHLQHNIVFNFWFIYLSFIFVELDSFFIHPHALYNMTIITILNIREIKILKQMRKAYKSTCPFSGLRSLNVLTIFFSHDLSLLSWFSSYLPLSAGFFILSSHQKLGRQFLL